jgi:predicted naringenin-chalcone synthase
VLYICDAVEEAMSSAYVNRISTSLPTNDVHDSFVSYALRQIESDRRRFTLFQRLADKGEIHHRYSFLDPSAAADSASLNGEIFYKPGAFPSTSKRMRAFSALAPKLASEAVEGLDLGEDRDRITHLIITCCTGFSAPGLDFQIIEDCGLPKNVERTIVGFMGCYAAINALKLARHTIRSEPEAKVLVLNLEMCTLHLQETENIEQMLSFFLFGDGCAACLMSSEPQGVALDSFHAVLAPRTQELITWDIGDMGFDMVLSGQVPAAIRASLSETRDAILRGASVDDIDLWAIHPGGRSVLDAVERALDLKPEALRASREVLRRYGNMSSPTVMFVLKTLMETQAPGQRGCAMAFGPGLVAETMLFHAVT